MPLPSPTTNPVTTPQPVPTPAPPTENVAGIPDWQAAIASFAILLLVAESDTWGPVAGAFAWAIASYMILDTIHNFRNLKP